MANKQETKLVISAEDRTKRALTGASNRIKKFEYQAKAVGKALAPIAAGASAAAGALLFMTKKAVDNADRVAKMSQRLGASTEALSEYEYVAERTGVRVETLTMGWQRMTRRVAEAARGTGEAQGALRELNLDASELAQLAPEEQFEKIADAIQKVKTPADKVRLAMKLFDSEGVSLLQTMEGGSEAMKALREEAKKLGISLDENSVATAVRARDAMTRLEYTMKGLGNVLLDELGPALADLANWLASEIPTAVEKLQRSFVDAENFVAKFQNTLAGMAGAVGLKDLEKQYRNSVSVIIYGVSELTQSLDGMRAGVDVLDEALKDGKISIDQWKGILQELTLNPLTEADDVASRMSVLNDALEAGKITLDEYRYLTTQLSFKSLDDDVKKSTGSIREQGEAIAKTDEQLKSFVKSLESEFSTNQQKAATAMSSLNDALERGIIDLEQYRQLAENISFKFAEPKTPELEYNKMNDEQRAQWIQEQIDLQNRLREAVDDTWDIDSGSSEWANQVTKDTERAARVAQGFSNIVADGFATAFVSSIKSAENFGDALVKVFEDLALRLVATGIFNILGGLFTGGLGSLFGGGITSVLGNIFGFKAEGGPVSANKPYIVGEEGPELFVPRTNGGIIPNGETGGVTNNNNITLNVQGVTLDDPLTLRRVTELINDELEQVQRCYQS